MSASAVRLDYTLKLSRHQLMLVLLSFRISFFFDLLPLPMMRQGYRSSEFYMVLLELDEARHGMDVINNG